METYMERKDIFTEISKDAYNASVWIYVKLQSHMERLLIRALEIMGYQSKGSVKDNISAIAEFVPSYNFDSFYELNRKANNVKHNNHKEEVYDREFLLEFSCDFNQFIHYFGLDEAEFKLDESLFEKPLSVTHDDGVFNEIEPKVINSTKKDGYIFIPCSVGSQESGFRIYYKEGNGAYLSGFEKSIYAVIFNFLQRSTYANKPEYLKQCEIADGVTYNYSTVFRCQMIILLLIWKGYAKNGVIEINCNSNNVEHFMLAQKCISHYAIMLAALCGKDIVPIDIKCEDNGVSVSIDEKADIWIAPSNDEGTAREYWFSDNLHYKIDSDEQEKVLQEFLQDFFGYKEFRPGQKEAIKQTLNTENRSICIMPTGAGKSLVFYMNILLSPCPSIIISPTKVLAKDQQRNLKEMHNIDDCIVYGDMNEQGLELNHKFIYMTPEDLQSYSLIVDIIKANVKYMISNVFLDEVHTLCNWSHDFRPDYLMLCNNLFSFVDHCRYIGFTATANYKVIEDLLRQLKIGYDSVIQPIFFNAGDFDFEFISCESDTDQLETLLRKFKEFIDGRENYDDKMIVFTHNYNESRELSDKLALLDNYDTSCFDAEHTYSYREFVDGNKHILIADSEMGIGINLPGVVCTVHFGLPPSKAQYVQEIGRANRKMNHGKSIVIFQNHNNLSQIESELLRFETSTDDIVRLISHMETNIAKLFRTILGSTESYNSSATSIRRIYDELDVVNNYTIEKFAKRDRKRFQKYLYKLHLLGVIDNWYVKAESDESVAVQIEVDYKKNEINSVKENILRYLNMMGAQGSYTHHIQNANTVEEIIFDFERWFYDEFLRYHREQLLNVVEFFNYYSGQEDRTQILRELEMYFSTAFEEMDDGKKYIAKISLEELFGSFSSVSYEINSVAEQLLMNSYDVKSDLVCFIYQFNKGNSDSSSRLVRIINNLPSEQRRCLLEHLYKYYESMDDDNKLAIFNAMSHYFSDDIVVNSIFRRIPRDLIYFGYVAKNINMKMGD